MNKQEIMVIIRDSFVEILEHKDFVLEDRTTANDVEGWESITHMMIINEIEKRFQIKFQLMDLMNMDDIGSMVNIIQKEIQNK